MVNVAGPFLPDAILYVKHSSTMQTTLVMGNFMSMKLILEQKTIVFKLMNVSYLIIFDNDIKRVYSLWPCHHSNNSSLKITMLLPVNFFLNTE